MALAPDHVMAMIDDLYPMCRSITGPGVRATLDRVSREIPLERHALPTGTKVLDWEVPDEWTIRDAHISRAGSSERVVDFRRSNLHVVSYSEPVDTRLTLDELRPHLFSRPDRPAVIPYRTSYYSRSWGFCLADEQLQSLVPGDYDVVIDSTLAPGSLEWGELVIPGNSSEEVLLTTHVCHPSLCNDNLTGIAALVEVARHLLEHPGRYTYRLLFIPATIGSIAWLATNPEAAQRIRHGLVLTGLGDASPLTYKSSRRGNADIDRIARLLVQSGGRGGRVLPFSPYGYDERQFCSPGFDLPVGRLTRGVHGEYPEYHTSADDLDFISSDQVHRSVSFIVELLEALEANRRYNNLAPFGEPQLGRRGLYSAIGGGVDQRSVEMAYLWVMSGSDGTKDLCDIAESSGLDFGSVAAAAQRLADVGLLAPAE